MTINELLALNNLTANDQIPVWDAEATGSTEPTAKITAQNFANAVKSIANLIGIGDLDATPTQGSTNAAQSGGVYTAIQQSTAFVPSMGNAGFHNSIYRGKNLGTSVTAVQYAAISAGTFDDLFIGDYWTINGVNWRIADFDPYYRCGNNISLGHHIAVVPDTDLYSTQWNDTNTTAGGYVASKIRTNIKSSTNGNAEGAELKVIAAFGSSHVLSYRALYPTTYDSSGNATGWEWVDARVELMNENEVYGSQVWSVGGKGYEVGMNKRQLSLFRIAPQFINIRADWWLRSVGSATFAAFVLYSGGAYSLSASTSLGVRPLSLIA